MEKHDEDLGKKIMERIDSFLAYAEPEEIKAVIDHLKGRHLNIISRFNETEKEANSNGE